MGRARLGTLYLKSPRAKRWTGAFTHPITGRRVIRTLYSDKQASRAALDQLIRSVERCAEGLEDPHAEKRRRPLTEHIAEYIAHCQHERQAPRHILVKQTQLRRFVEWTGAKRIDDLTLESSERVLRGLVSQGLSARTHNHHRATLLAFMSWAKETDRAGPHALNRLPTLDERCDRRRKRRALTEDELRRLFYVARWRPLAEYGRLVVRRPKEDSNGRATWTRAPLTLDQIAAAVVRARKALSKRPDYVERLERLGQERELIYKTLVLTGLRKGELASLTVGDLHLGHTPPYAVLGARADKARLGAEIPLRPDLAADVRAWLADGLAGLRAQTRRGSLPTPAGSLAESKLFKVPTTLVVALGRDLRVAGIHKHDDRGCAVDVHALRHTFGTHLAKHVMPRTAQAAMRHSTIQLTMSLYTDPRLLEVVTALDALPMVSSSAALRHSVQGSDQPSSVPTPR
ncbi:MAG: site-specific integrase [Phycisphaerales bacterium]